jgi:hypothetical protein
MRSPAATLEPLHDIFKYILKIRECSVHSVNANFILFILQIAATVRLECSMIRDGQNDYE